MAVEVFAPAKVNLTLHVTGRRADGYHDLDSLVVFVDAGDRVVAAPAPMLRLTIDGPQAAGLSDGDDNLVLRAARLIGGPAAAIRLQKVLPVASGIGGGSADAAATLKALAALGPLALPRPEALLHLGADVPVCLHGRPCRMTGSGGSLAPLPGPLPPAVLVLANAGVSLATSAVFAALDRRDRAPMPPVLPLLRDFDALAGFLAAQRNDLEPPAMALAPVIADTRAALAAQPGCRLARMSGSGATCFGLFADATAASRAARTLARAQPGWWVQTAAITPRQ
jgi:4-diphosphocytidyl-2-C-methyl-D-erythritol kinase